MTKVDSKKKIEEEAVEEQVEEVQDFVEEPEPEAFKGPTTNVEARFTAAVKAHKPVNRSADLVPLGKDFDKMRKRLRSLILAAKKYHVAQCELEKSRNDVALKMSKMTEDTPLNAATGQNIGKDSLVTVHQVAAEEAKRDAKLYQENVINYLLEWERIVMTKVDADLEEVHKLHERLNHYQGKIEKIRKRVNMMEDKLKITPKKLQEKLERNENKLEQAWKDHEKKASTTCNLLEEVTKRGWKDLYPVLKASMQWESDHAAHEYDVFALLPNVQNELTFAFREHDKPPQEEASQVPVALAEKASEEIHAEEEEYSDTSGSYHAPGEEEASTASEAGSDKPVVGDLEDVPVPASPEMKPAAPKTDATPASPTGVVEH